MKFNMGECKPTNAPVDCGIKLPRIDDGEKVNPTTFKKLAVFDMYLWNWHC